MSAAKEAAEKIVHAYWPSVEKLKNKKQFAQEIRTASAEIRAAYAPKLAEIRGLVFDLMSFDEDEAHKRDKALAAIDELMAKERE